MMNNFKQILLTIAFVACVSVSATAQKDEDKKPPPKEKPPVIIVNPDKKPKEDKPKEGKRPQEMAFNSREEIELA